MLVVLSATRGFSFGYSGFPSFHIPIRYRVSSGLQGTLKRAKGLSCLRTPSLNIVVFLFYLWATTEVIKMAADGNLYSAESLINTSLISV